MYLKTAETMFYLLGIGYLNYSHLRTQTINSAEHFQQQKEISIFMFLRLKNCLYICEKIVKALYYM